MEGRNAAIDPLDVQMMKDAQDALARQEKIELSYTVNNTDRAIDARLSGTVAGGAGGG